MPRAPRLSRPGIPYHVILRGNARRDIFYADRDFLRFYQLLEQGLAKYDHNVVAFCLMTNHVHLVIKLGNDSISKILHALTFRYAQYLNWRLESIGHVFQGRFKSRPVKDIGHMRSLLRYVHLNPVTAGMASLPEDYRWSSYGTYVDTEQIPWLSPSIGLDCFGTTEASRIVAFKKFTRVGLHPHKPLDIETGQIQVTLDCLVDAVCRHYEISPESLRTDSRGEAARCARGALALMARGLAGIGVHDVAAYLQRSTAAIWKSAARLQCRFDQSPQLKSEFEALFDDLFAI